ncbi:hypothetical protein QFC19_001250 [Naganishia cerealis]|uniref:Uncharacterized protein n=1 Tax=Naganishia cerealis TaxID=610337 RepID=A0ACC2WHE0_9TREE|nr:hypothetical protein QFC19_001250 [Naganishia cerealis]
MGLSGRKPVLPFLPMPQRTCLPSSQCSNPSHEMPAFAFPSSASASGTSTPCYSDGGGGMSLPHTPLPGTPLALEKASPARVTWRETIVDGRSAYLCVLYRAEQYWPLMITPTPAHNQPFSFDLPTSAAACLPSDSSCKASTSSMGSSTSDAAAAEDSPGSAGSAGTLTGLEDVRARELRQHGGRLGSTWSMGSGVGEDEDGLEWDDREEGILLSFLDNPLHPLATPYPPGTLPPSSALDDITTQIIRFHSPPTPVGGDSLNLTELICGGGKPGVTGLGITTSPAPSLPSARKHAAGASKHRRTHSASGIPWSHSWKATRRKLYEIARREALGMNREDRFKGRVISPPVATPAARDDEGLEVEEEEEEGRESSPAAIAMADCMATPLYVPRSATTTGVPTSTTRTRTSPTHGEVTETPSGRIMKRPGGGIMMQRHGSETMLEFPDASIGQTFPLGGMSMDEGEGEGAARGLVQGSREDQQISARSIGQALRLSSSLQRSTKTGPAGEIVAKPVRPTGGMQRKPSLLQRGQSFTADDFNNCLTLSSDSGSTPPPGDDETGNGGDSGTIEFTGFDDQDCVTPSAVFDNRTPTLQTVHHFGGAGQQQDMFDDMFGQYGIMSPSSDSGTCGEEPFAGNASMDTEMIPATPDQSHGLPCILLTKTSPTPMIRARNGSGSSDLEMVSPSPADGALPIFQAMPATGGLGTPLNLSPPGSPRARPQKDQHPVPSFYALDQDRTPRPVIASSLEAMRPGLIRARSSTAAYTTPSAFSQFMNNTANNNVVASGPIITGEIVDLAPRAGVMDAELQQPALPRSPAALGLSMPSAKRQKIGITHPHMTVPFAGFNGALDDRGLASPFDEKRMF